MAKPAEKMRAIALRRESLSTKEIARRVGVSSGTVRAWLREAVLTDEQEKLLYERQIAAGHRGRLIGAEMNRQKKLDRLEVARKLATESIETISNEQLFYLGLGLYWGEGSKANTSGPVLTNSDPAIIRLMMRWFSECLEVERERFEPRVFISDIHRDREAAIHKFWVETLAIPSEQFKRTIFLNKGKKIYENRDIYYGVLAPPVSQKVQKSYIGFSPT